jgi:hypothetical protein
MNGVIGEYRRARLRPRLVFSQLHLRNSGARLHEKPAYTPPGGGNMNAN